MMFYDIVYVVVCMRLHFGIIKNLSCVKYYTYSLLLLIVFVLYHVHYHVIRFPLYMWTSLICLLDLVMVSFRIMKGRYPFEDRLIIT